MSFLFQALSGVAVSPRAQLYTTRLTLGGLTNTRPTLWASARDVWGRHLGLCEAQKHAMRRSAQSKL